jgi:hypothetical protein
MMRATLEWRQQNDVGEHPVLRVRLMASACRHEQQAGSKRTHAQACAFHAMLREITSDSSQ